MITDYLNPKAIEGMALKEFKTLLKENPAIALRVMKDGYTESSAFKALGGKARKKTEEG